LRGPFASLRRGGRAAKADRVRRVSGSLGVATTSCPARRGFPAAPQRCRGVANLGGGQPPMRRRPAGRAAGPVIFWGAAQGAPRPTAPRCEAGCPLDGAAPEGGNTAHRGAVAWPFARGWLSTAFAAQAGRRVAAARATPMRSTSLRPCPEGLGDLLQGHRDGHRLSQPPPPPHWAF